MTSVTAHGDGMSRILAYRSRSLMCAERTRLDRDLTDRRPQEHRTSWHTARHATLQPEGETGKGKRKGLPRGRGNPKVGFPRERITTSQKPITRSPGDPRSPPPIRSPSASGG